MPGRDSRILSPRKAFLTLILLISLIAAPFLVVTGFFALEVALGLGRGRGTRCASSTTVRATVIVPAHDEAPSLEPMLRALRKAADGQADILLVADNCTDDTAVVGRAVGIRTIERNDAARRGKGFALAFGRDALAADPPAVVVILDADCRIDRESLATLIAQCAMLGHPCQTVNLLRPSDDCAPMVEISNFAFMLKNLVRQRGLQRLIGSVHLTGTGMAFPWRLIANAPLATASVVEDVKLGIELTQAGTPPRLVPEATVWSEPSSVGGTLIQRERWEGGNLALARAIAPPLLIAAVRRADVRLLVRAVDLLVPPLTMLILANLLVGIIIVGALALTGDGLILLAAWSAINLAAAMVVFAAWAVEGRPFLRPRTLAAIPGYMLWKLPLYAKIRRGGVKDWLRAGR